MLQEIFEMKDEDLDVQNANLIAELSDIDKEMDEAIKEIKSGDRFYSQELSEEYLQNMLYFSPDGCDR